MLRPEHLVLARQAFSAGDNVTATLRAALGVDRNTPDIIEAAYELQAGSYVEAVTTDRASAEARAKEMSNWLASSLREGDTLLDAGTGEMTMLSLVLGSLGAAPAHTFAFDISWSRLRIGQSFVAETLPGALGYSLHPLVAQMGAIPLADGVVDITTTCHALEPNGQQLEPLLKELMRVTRRRLVLFEPSYENASAVGQARMERLGYIRGLADTAERLGGRVLETAPMAHVSNPLNPTHVFVVDVERALPPREKLEVGALTVPGTQMTLEKVGDHLFCEEAGLVFPIIDGLPVLKLESGVWASFYGQVNG